MTAGACSSGPDRAAAPPPSTTTPTKTTLGPAPARVVRQAARQVLARTGTRLVLGGRAVVAGEAVVLHGTGVVLPGRSASETTLSFRFEGEEFTQRMLQVGSRTYVDEVAGGKDMLAALGARWAELPPSMAARAALDSPLGALKSLASPTYEVRPWPAAATAAAGTLGSPRYHVWLGAHDQLLRMAISTSVPALGQVDLQVRLRGVVRLTALNAPSAGQVVPYQRFLELLKAT